MYNPQQQEVDQNVQQQPAAPTFDPAQLAQITANATAEAIRRSQPDPNAEPEFARMTPEQKREHLREFNPDDSFIGAFATAFRPDDNGQIDAVQARGVLNQFRDGVAAQAIRTAELLMERKLEEMNRTYLPAIQAVKEQRAQQVWSSFTAVYPGLAPFRQVVDAVANSFTPVPGMQQDQILAAIAQQTETLIRQANPAFSARSGGQGQQTSPQQGHQFSPPSGGGFTPATVSPGYAHTRVAAPKNTNPFYDAEVFG